MALPTSGTISASMIQKELKESGSWSINSPSSRKLAKVPSGTIKFTDFYGKATSETVNEYVLYKNSWNRPGDTETSYGRLKNAPFKFSFKIPRKIIKGVIKVNVSYSGDGGMTRFGAFVDIPEIGRYSVGPYNNYNSGTKNVENYSPETFICNGDVGCFYREQANDNTTFYFIKSGTISVTVTFTGEWEPNNLYYKLLDYFSSFFKEVRNICQSL